MRILVGITSCAKYAARRRAQLETWILEHWLTPPRPGLDVVVRYFVGQDGPVEDPDPLICYLRCPDDYAGGPKKTERLIDFAIANDFDFLFKCDDDTYVRVDRLLSSGFERAFYRGWTIGRDYAQGGAGYWLARDAMRMIRKIGVEHWNEDAGVGAALAKFGIEAEHDGRYMPGMGSDEAIPPRRSNDVITLHNCRPEPAIAPSSVRGVEFSGSFRRSMHQVHEEYWS